MGDEWPETLHTKQKLLFSFFLHIPILNHDPRLTNFSSQNLGLLLGEGGSQRHDEFTCWVWVPAKLGIGIQNRDMPWLYGTYLMYVCMYVCVPLSPSHLPILYHVMVNVLSHFNKHDSGRLRVRSSSSLMRIMERKCGACNIWQMADVLVFESL